MTAMTRRRWALATLVTAVLAGLLTVGTWASQTALNRPVGAPPGPGTAGDWYGPGMMGGQYGPGMMGGGYGPGMMGGGYGPGMMGGPYGPGMMGNGYGPGMMGGRYGLPGDGRPVQTLTAAHQRAQLFADRLGLRAGEVMQFSNNFYSELLTNDGQGATEVLIDPASGAVGVEYGPAMMWNTRYGMHAGAPVPPAQVSAADATRLAQQDRRNAVGQRLYRRGVVPHLARHLRRDDRGLSQDTPGLAGWRGMADRRRVNPG
jgi:hypothetical protein